MKSLDNKKAQNLDGTGFQLSLFRDNDMITIAQPQYNSNSKPLVIDSFSIRQDEAGRYCINDLHKASGGLRKDRPSYFLENEKTQDLIQAIKDENYDVGNSASYIEPVNIIRGRGKEQGTYVVRELVYSYGMWISAKFHLTVIRAYDALTMNQSLSKTHKSERTPLHDAHALLVAKTKHLNSSDAWKIINQRFGTKSINEIPYDQIPIAVEYVHHLIALYSGAERQTRNEYWTNADVQALMYYAPKFGKFVRDDLGPALSHLRSEYAAQIIGIAQEMAASANALNRLAWGWGLTHYDKLGGQPLHTMEWYLTK